MTEKEFRGLQTGDIIRGITKKDLYIITANYGTHMTAVRVIDICHPSEWDLIFKSNHTRIRD